MAFVSLLPVLLPALMKTVELGVSLAKAVRSQPDAGPDLIARLDNIEARLDVTAREVAAVEIRDV